jgi:hypothetical protein
MDKKGLGGLIILVGIAFIGFVWFRRNKPVIADKQLQDLKNQSNNLATSADSIDKPFDYSEQSILNQGVNPYVWSLDIDYTNLTPKEREDLDMSVICPLCSGLNFVGKTSKEVSQNLRKVSWSNIKI